MLLIKCSISEISGSVIGPSNVSRRRSSSSLPDNINRFLLLINAFSLFLVSPLDKLSCSPAMARYPWPEILLFQALRVVVLYPTRHHLYQLVVLAAMVYIAAQIYRTTEVTHPLIATYLVGTVTAFYLTSTLSSVGGRPLPRSLEMRSRC